MHPCAPPAQLPACYKQTPPAASHGSLLWLPATRQLTLTRLPAAARRLSPQAELVARLQALVKTKADRRIVYHQREEAGKA